MTARHNEHPTARRSDCSAVMRYSALAFMSVTDQKQLRPPSGGRRTYRTDYGEWIELESMVSSSTAGERQLLSAGLLALPKPNRSEASRYSGSWVATLRRTTSRTCRAMAIAFWASA
jgi:hypothetical protein